MTREPKRIVAVSGDGRFLGNLLLAFHTEGLRFSDCHVSTYPCAEKLEALLGMYRPHVVILTSRLAGSMSGPVFVRAIPPDRREQIAIIGAYWPDPHNNRQAWDGVKLDELIGIHCNTDLRNLANRAIMLAIATTANA